jgi:Na+-translocating ferredoxin:NAD+ oxidoreductase RnfG subunit
VLIRDSFIWLTPLAIVGTPVAGYGVTYLTPAQAAKAIFPGKAIASANLKLSGAQKDAVKKASGVNVRTLEIQASRTSAGDWLIIDVVLGKHEFITYAVGISAAGKVVGIEIMEYRESYGDEIRNPKWRAQFTGKEISAPLKLDRDIQNIGGATLSCRHITDGVKRLLALHDLVLRQR